jgi:phosphoglycerate dehydrogenase-like enzyme
MLNQESFPLMKPTAYLINLGRGGLIERESLAHALATGQIAGAGLDVFWTEPPDPEDPIFRYNVLATPHVAGATDITAQGIQAVVGENLRRLNRGAPLFHVQGAQA